MTDIKATQKEIQIHKSNHWNDIALLDAKISLKKIQVNTQVPLDLPIWYLRMA